MLDRPTDPQLEISAEQLRTWLRDDVARDIDAILDERPDNFPSHTSPENAAFLFWVARNFIDASPNDLLFADGPNDAQIDIFHHTESDERILFRVYQVSGPSLSEIAAGRRGRDIGDKLETDARGLHNAISRAKLRRTQYNPTAEQALGYINTSIERSSSGDGPPVVIELVPITLRRIPTEKRERYDRLASEARETWSSEVKGLTWNLHPPHGAEELYQLYYNKRPAELPQELSLRIPFGAAIEPRRSSPILTFAKAIDILEAYARHRASLFDANLRFELDKKSAVNEKIAAELDTVRGIRRFHEKNNGIVIACSNARQTQGRKNDALPGLKLARPQIINGAQTVSTLFRVYSGLKAKPLATRTDKDKDRLKLIEEELLLPVKVVAVEDWQKIDEIAVASNTQNALSERTARSASLEMRRLKVLLAEASRPWFAETKDGEWEALRENKSLIQKWTRGRTPKDFRYGSKKSEVRKLDNKDLGVALLCLHGFLEEAKYSGLFRERTFLRAFNLKVRDDKWQALLIESPKPSEPTDERLSDIFEPAPPGPHQHILAYVLFGFLHEWTFPETRQLVLAYEERARKEPGFLQYRDKDKVWVVPDEERRKTLESDDSCYWTERVARAAYKSLVHQAMRILVQRYGSLREEVARGILCLPEFSRCFEGHHPRVLGDFREARLDRGPLTTIGRILHLACRNLWVAYAGEIRHMLSPQQTLITYKWVQRMSEQVDAICKRIGNVAYRTATGLDPDGDVRAGSLSDLLPAVDLSS